MASDIHWHELETRYTTIHYQSSEDLYDFNHNVDYAPRSTNLKWIFSNAKGDPLVDRIRGKMDTLYERVREILGMYKPTEKICINIYQDKKQLHDVYFEIYKQGTRLRAWYIFEKNTIYINVNDLHEGMLAHEMAHSIIDNYLTVRPPSASAEILARYVDEHLFD